MKFIALDFSLGFIMLLGFVCGLHQLFGFGPSTVKAQGV